MQSAKRRFTVTVEVEAPLTRDVHAALDAANAYLYTQGGFMTVGKIREHKKQGR
jgi:hypothetical protein